MHIDLNLLGGLAVTIDGAVVAPQAWKSRRSAQLVEVLALSPGHRLKTEQVMDALWPDLSPSAARANLHKAATLARQAMGSKDSVVLRGDSVSLWPSVDVDLSVDVEQFEREARAALASGRSEEIAGVAHRFSADLLPEERYEDWSAQARDRVERLHLDLLRAGGLWDELTEAEPTDEVAHRELMRQHFEAGRLHAAIRQFQRLRTILARELGVLPSPDTVALYRRIIGTATSDSARPGLVGREADLVRARATLRRAAEGRPAALFVSGPAGIGKTRFCEELVEQTEAEGWSVLRSAGRQQTAAVPFWPIVEAVQAVMVERPYLANALADADRALLTRLAGFGADQPSAPVHRHAVLHLVANLVAAMGAPRSLLFLDDLHNVDDDTLALAEVLAAAPAPRGIVLVATYRTGTGERESAMARSTVARGFGAEVTLHPLRRADTDAVVGEALGRPASEADRELAWQLSEGNPFFALEVAAALSSDEAAGGSGAYGAIDIRLQRLPAGTLELLRSVAVVAYEFSADEFAALGGVDADGALEHLQVALGEGVIARQASSYRYRHDLVRDRLTEGVTPAERAAAHAAAAGRLAALAAPAARIAHHLLAAGSPEESLPWLRRAAADAMTVGAYADALMAANRALQVAPGDPPMLALRADALNALGEPGAAAAYSLAMAVSSEPERAALAVRRAKALIMAGDIPAAMDTLGSVRSVPAEARAQLEVARGLACWCTGALDDAEEAGRQAKRLAEETGQLRDFVDATMVLAMVAHERGGWPQRLSLDMLDPTIAPDLAAVVIDAHLCVAESYLYGGVPYADVIQFASELRRDAADSAAPRAEAFATTLLGEAHLLMGDAETAAGYLRAAAEQHQRVGVLCGEALSLQRLAEAALAQGDQSQARSALSGALMAARGSPLGTRHLLHRVYGTAVRAAADSQIALAAVDEAARAVRGPSEACPPCSITFTVPATIACASAGDLERATAYLTAAEQVAAAFYPRGGWPAALDEARGYVALANGDGDSALRLFSGAADAFTHLGQALDASRCRDQLAALNGGGKVSGRSGS